MATEADIIDMAIDGDVEGIRSAVAELLNAKAAEHLTQRRVEIAQNFFKSED